MVKLRYKGRLGFRLFPRIDKEIKGYGLSIEKIESSFESVKWRCVNIKEGGEVTKGPIIVTGEVAFFKAPSGLYVNVKHFSELSGE